ncbi:hypothetical protein AB8616_07055 [Marinomonas sp. RS-M-Aa-14]|uniref:hypothetical protein n=1 Tax=Marinomonas sp. RS-M-Aa-14 TaxID=3241169 RepID=UPI003AB01A22
MVQTLKDSVIAVIYGGRSAERDVSMQSGPLVAEGLRSKGFNVVEPRPLWA